MKSREAWSAARRAKVLHGSALGSFLVGVLVALGGACGGDVANEPLLGGESHFLDRCSTTCEGAFECISGICTKSCDPAVVGACSMLAGAVCTAESVLPPAAPVCDLPCIDRAGCAELRTDYECVDGFCRAPAAGIDTGTGGTTSAGGASSLGNGGAAGSPRDCADYLDTPGDTELAVSIRNDRATPIFLVGFGGCDVASGEWVAFERDGQSIGTFSVCVPSCAEVQATGQPQGPPCDLCSFPMARLGPGEQLDAGSGWRQYLTHGSGERAPMPRSCYEPRPGTEDIDPVCVSSSPMPEGEYVLQARAYTAVECPEGTLCDCDPNTEPGCAPLAGRHQGVGDELSASATARLPGSAVVISFR